MRIQKKLSISTKMRKEWSCAPPVLNMVLKALARAIIDKKET